MFVPIALGLTVLHFTRCTISAPIQNRQVSLASYNALSDWAEMYTISNDLGSFFDTLSQDQPGAQIAWDAPLTRVWDMVNLMEDSSIQLISLASGFQFHPDVDVLPWAECYVLVSTYAPTWRLVYDISINLAKAAAVFGEVPRSDFWSTQNATYHIGSDLTTSVSRLCNDPTWYFERESASESIIDAATCAMQCLSNQPGTICDNLTCPTFST